MSQAEATQVTVGQEDKNSASDDQVQEVQANDAAGEEQPVQPDQDKGPGPSRDGPTQPQAASSKDQDTGETPTDGDLKRILQLEVPIIVRLAERMMPLADILALTAGTVIEFEKDADEELELMINNKCIGKGVAVKVGENFGLRVTYIGPVAETIKAMGK